MHTFDTTTKAGTATGTLLSLFANIGQDDLMKTAILAAVGATVSFSITICLKLAYKKCRK